MKKDITKQRQRFGMRIFKVKLIDAVRTHTHTRLQLYNDNKEPCKQRKKNQHKCLL